MSKTFWGPPIWSVIHSFAFTVDDNNKSDFVMFLNELPFLLPCDVCRKNLTYKLEKYPPSKYTSSRKQAFTYTYMIHDMVNQHVTEHTPDNKVSPPFEDVVGKYIKGMNSGPEFWGPPTWSMLHIFGASLREGDHPHFIQMLSIVQRLLPDRQSRSSMKEFMEKTPPQKYMTSNHDAFAYTYLMHVHVNNLLGKSSPEYTDVKYEYFSKLGQKCNDCQVP